MTSNSMAMSLSKVQETVNDREAWCAAVRGTAKSHNESDTTGLLNNNNGLSMPNFRIPCKLNHIVITLGIRLLSSQ